MGYTTEFEGSFNIEPALKPELNAYMKAFNSSRRMKRDAKIADTFEDPLRKSVGLPIGIDGEFYVGSHQTNFGQVQDKSTITYNGPPSTQPGLWCQWVPNEEGTKLMWDEGEKFYEYIDWLKYIIKNFMIPFGHTLNGTVIFQGEDPSDNGAIIVVDNEIK